MVILTHHGVHYLKSSWNLDVDKNGKTRKADQTKTPISGSDYRASQQLDSKILSFDTKYYVEPKKKVRSFIVCVCVCVCVSWIETT